MDTKMKHCHFIGLKDLFHEVFLNDELSHLACQGTDKRMF